MIPLLIGIALAVTFIVACTLIASSASDWAQCECGLWHNTRNGRTSLHVPEGWDGVRVDRLCQDCASNLSGQSNVAGVVHNTHRSGNCIKAVSTGLNIPKASAAVPTTFSQAPPINLTFDSPNCKDAGLAVYLKEGKAK